MKTALSLFVVASLSLAIGYYLGDQPTNSTQTTFSLDNYIEPKEKKSSDPSVVEHRPTMEQEDLAVELKKEEKTRYLRIIEEKDDVIRNLENQIEYLQASKSENITTDVIPNSKQLLSGGKIIAEVSQTGQALYLKDGVYIKEDNKLLLYPDMISSGKKSIPSNKRSNISFTNTTGEDLYLFWVDYNGEPTFSDKLSPGESHAGITSVGAVHVVTRTDGEVFAYITPREGIDDIDIVE